MEESSFLARMAEELKITPDGHDLGHILVLAFLRANNSEHTHTHTPVAAEEGGGGGGWGVSSTLN